MFRKSDRLCGEIAGDPVASVPYAPPIDQVVPGDVLKVIDAAGRELAEIKRALGIGESVDPPARDAARTPSDVFGVLATVNRQINLLLARTFQPADCYQQVSLAVAYGARLGAAPKDAPFVRGKRPADCYERLSGCLELARALVKKAGHAVIDRPGVPGEANDMPPVGRLRPRDARPRRGRVPARDPSRCARALPVRGQRAGAQAAVARVAARRRARAAAEGALDGAPRAW